jgi:hypothetical protein
MAKLRTMKEAVYREALVLLRDRLREAQSGAELDLPAIVAQLDKILSWKGDKR